MARKEYANAPEEAFAVKAESAGWSVSKRGWPDFFCVKGHEVICVEVKPRTKSGRLKKLKRDQVAVLDFLKSIGVRCFVSDGATLEPYDREKHGSNKSLAAA